MGDSKMADRVPEERELKRALTPYAGKWFNWFG